MIQTDDQTLASMRALYRSRGGALRAVMPKTKRLLRRGGFEFTRAHTASPLCAPSRASLLTGQYPHNTGLIRNGGNRGGWKGWQGLPIRKRNLALALERSGYRTIQVGKFTNDYKGSPRSRFQTGIPPGWSRWLVPTDRHHKGFDRTRYYGYRLNVNRRVTGPLGRRFSERVDCWFGPGRARQGRPVCGHLTDRTTYLATRQIGRSRGPFFLSVSYSAPHIEWLGPGGRSGGLVGPRPSARHLGSTGSTGLPRPPSFNESNISDKPRFIRKGTPRLRPKQIRTTAVHYRNYLASLRGVDDGVGALLTSLRRSRKLGNTYVFFTSDNGLFFGEHRFAPSKFVPYQPILRVPLLVRGPGVPSGRSSAEPVSLVDIAPTVARLAGARLDYEVDGRNLRPYWRNPSLTSDRPLLFEVSGDSSVGKRELLRRAPFRRSRAIRVGRWKFVRYGGREFELYDLKRDPHELRNLTRVPRYSGVATSLKKALRRYEECVGVECRADLSPPPMARSRPPR